MANALLDLQKQITQGGLVGLAAQRQLQQVSPVVASQVASSQASRNLGVGSTPELKATNQALMQSLNTNPEFDAYLKTVGPWQQKVYSLFAQERRDNRDINALQNPTLHQAGLGPTADWNAIRDMSTPEGMIKLLDQAIRTGELELNDREAALIASGDPEKIAEAYMSSLTHRKTTRGLFSDKGFNLAEALKVAGWLTLPTTIGSVLTKLAAAPTLGEGIKNLLGGVTEPTTAGGTAAKNPNAVPGGSTGITTPTGGGIVGSGQLNPAGVGIMGNTASSGIALGWSPLAVAGGATPMPGVSSAVQSGSTTQSGSAAGSKAGSNILDTIAQGAKNILGALPGTAVSLGDTTPVAAGIGAGAIPAVTGLLGGSGGGGGTTGGGSNIVVPPNFYSEMARSLGDQPGLGHKTRPGAYFNALSALSPRYAAGYS